MQQILIGPSGTTRPANNSAIDGYLGYEHRPDWLFRTIELGFIFVAFGRRGLRIALRPNFVSRAALARLYGLLARQNPPRVALAQDASLWSWELVGSTREAITRIELLVTEARNPAPRWPLTEARLPLERCSHIGHGRLLLVLQAWGQRQGRWDSNFLGQLEEWQLLPNSTISMRPRGSERLLMCHWGENITTYGRDWPRLAPGRDVEDTPNAELGLRRAALQRRIISEGLPQLMAVDFSVSGPVYEEARVQFYRLCMPWLASDGVVFTTSFQIGRRVIRSGAADSAN
jgi:hypothetical protein